MLIGISPVIGPELLDALFRMGHGDEIVFADAFFPGDTYGKKVIRADGLKIPALLKGVLSLINLDTMVLNPVIMMDAVKGDSLDPDVEKTYREVIDKLWPGTPHTERIKRFAFYERAKQAYCVVMTGETVKYGNIILKKGVIPVKDS